MAAHSRAKSRTDEFRALDVRQLAKQGMLRPGHWREWQWKRNGDVIAWIRVRTEQHRVVLKYQHRVGGERWRCEEYPVHIVRTACHLGGSRPWFLCPGPGCGRRVAILYGVGIFACRHCHQLAYPSTRENAGFRALRRAERLRQRLGWLPGVLNGSGEKPRWMRRTTFGRLIHQHHRLGMVGIHAIATKLGFLDRLPTK